MPPPPTDAGELFRSHMPFVANFLVRLGVRRDDVDDAVQEVFLVAHRRGGYVPGPARPTTWLAAIALRVASSRQRARRRNAEDLDDTRLAAAAASEATPADATETREMLAFVQRALDALDLDHRAVMILFELEGEPCAAIAAALDVPINTVYSRLHAARASVLRACEQWSRPGRRAETARARP